MLESRTVLSTSAVAATGPAPAAQETLNLLLQPGDDDALTALSPAIASAGATIEATTVPGLYQLEGPAAAMGGLAARLAASPAVQSVGPQQTMQIADAPNDPDYLNDDQWDLDGTWGIDAPGAWSVTTGSSGVVVADTDTGLAYDNPDQYDNVWINQAEIPADVLPELTDVTGAGAITFADLNNAINQGAGKITPTDGVVDGTSLLVPMSSGGWAGGSTQDGDTATPDDLIGWNFVNNDNNPADGNGHGTFTAGEIGAVGDNGAGTTGVDWSVQIMPVEFLDSAGSGTDTAAAEAIEYAVNHGARVINASWGGGGTDTVIASAIAYADQHGVIIVAAAGNNGSDDDDSGSWFTPASYSVDYPNLISVAATDDNGDLASWSNYGVASVQLAAPGVNIYGESPGNNYGDDSGTSMAAPLVTGTIALVEAAHPTWSMSQVIDAVLDTTTLDPNLPGKVTTGGIVNAAAAVANTDGPYVTSATPSGSVATDSALSSVEVTFNEEINPATFTTSQATLTGPSGQSIAISSVAAVAGSNDHSFTISFASQSAAGDYTLKVGPDVQDWYGNDMNQNRNGVNGQATADQFVDEIARTAAGSSPVLGVTGLPARPVAGTAYSVTVTALSPGGGTDTGFVGTVDFSSTDPQESGLPSSYAFTASNDGTHTFSVTLKTAGDQSITASSTAAISGTEGNLIVQHAGVASLLVSPPTTPITADDPSEVTVTALDAYGNVATGFTGTVDFSSSDGKAKLPAAPVFVPEDDGTASFLFTFETAGSQSLTATSASNSAITGTATGLSVQAGSGTPGSDPTATAITSSTEPSAHGQSLTFTATVTSTTGGVANPTDGSVTFYDGTTALGAVPLSGSDEATYTTSALAPGTATIVAAYSGAGTAYADSPSAALTQVINHFATDVALTSALGSAHSLTLTARVTVVSPSGGVTAPVPTGTVSFYDGTTLLATEDLNSSDEATYTSSALASGSHALLAVYNGDQDTRVGVSNVVDESGASTQSLAVNPAWAADPTGTAVPFDLETYYVGYNAFGTIQAGVNAAAAGGTVNVLEGTYAQQVTIDKDLTLDGAGSSVSTLDVPSGVSSGSQLAVSGGATVTITGLGLAGASGLNGISVEGGSAATVTDSAITGDANGILVGSGSGDTSTLTAHYDDLAGDTAGVRNVQASGSVVATFDWWGEAGGPGSSGASAAVGSVTDSPWLLDVTGASLATPDALGFSTAAGDAWTVTPDDLGLALDIALNGNTVGTVTADGSIAFSGSGGTLAIYGESGGNFGTDVFDVSNGSVEFDAGDNYSGATITYSGITSREVYAESAANTFKIDGTGTGGIGGSLWGIAGGTTAFDFTGSSALAGNIQGAGASTLSYAGYGSGVSVNLGTGSATGVGGTVSGITAVVGSPDNDTLNAGSVAGVTLTGGLGTNVLSGSGAGDNVTESFASGYTLTNSSLTGTNVSFSDSLSGIKVANLTDTAGGHTFTLSGWTGTGSLTGSGSVLVASEDIAALGGNVWLGNTEIMGGSLLMTLSGIRTAELTDTGTTGGNFGLGGWTGTGSVTGGSAAHPDSVSAWKSAGFTLSDTTFSTTDGMSMSLGGTITAADLDDTGGGHTFTLSGWTGSGSFADSGSAADTLSAVKSADITLKNTSITAGDGLSMSLSGPITAADLTVTATSGNPAYVVDASAFTGRTALSATGTVDATLFGGSGADGTLTSTGSGNSILIGGPAADTLTDTGTGHNILIGAGGADTVTGNGDDILISGTTSYDSDTGANIAALSAILAEWDSSDSYSTRIAKITDGVGSDGTEAFNTSTVQSNNKINTVSDGSGAVQNNWFIVNSSDKVTRRPGEEETIV